MLHAPQCHLAVQPSRGASSGARRRHRKRHEPGRVTLGGGTC